MITMNYCQIRVIGLAIFVLVLLYYKYNQLFSETFQYGGLSAAFVDLATYGDTDKYMYGP